MATNLFPYADTPLNRELLGLIEQLRSRGYDQNTMAIIAGISAGQLSRVKQGERPATAAHVERLRNALYNLPQVEWPVPIPVNERLPEPCVEVLLYDPDAHRWRLGEYRGFGLGWVACIPHGLPEPVHPTHWLPLPPKPGH